MDEFEYLEILREQFKSKGAEGLLPQNLPDCLMDILGDIVEYNEGLRRGLVAATIGLIVYGNTRIMSCSEITFGVTMLPYILNCILEKKDRDVGISGMVHPTLEDLFYKDRVAICRNNTEVLLSQAIFTPQATVTFPSSPNEVNAAISKEARRRESIMTITCIVSEARLDAFSDLDKLFSGNTVDGRGLCCRIIEPVKYNGMDCWHYSWENLRLNCDRRTLSFEIRKWAAGYAKDIINYNYSNSALAGGHALSMADLKKVKSPK